MASSQIEFYVKLPSGKTITLRLSPRERVEDIISEVSKEICPSSDQRVRIKYDKKVLNESNRIGYLGICQETILKAEVLVATHLDLNIRWTDQTESIWISNIASVIDLRTKISELLDIEMSKPIIRCGNRTLINERQSLFDAGITDGASIDVYVKGFGEDESVNEYIDKDEPLTKEERLEIISSFDFDSNSMDVVFSFCVTFMGIDTLKEVRTRVIESCKILLRDIPNIRIGIIAHSNYSDHKKYVLKSVALTSDLDAITTFVTSVPGIYSGFRSKCYEWLLRSVQRLNWAKDSSKALIVIGDSTPNEPSYTDLALNWHHELDVLKDMRVKVYGIQASNQINAKPFYEELAARTGGCYLRLKEFPLITDMFLSAYSRASSPAPACHDEESQWGRIKEDTQVLFDDIGPERYVPEPWWDPLLDTHIGPNKYCYDQSTNSFYEHRFENPNLITDLAELGWTQSPGIHYKKVRKRSLLANCSIM